jgi:hypothetical protein
LSRIDLADLQNNTGWTPPPIPPTPEVAETSPGEGLPQDLPPGAFQTGEFVRNITSSRVNIRSTPGYLGKPEGDVIAQVLPGERVEILNQRVIADNLNWWLIRYTAPNGFSLEGWIAEATASGVQILGR